jgi:hypothetical protein
MGDSRLAEILSAFAQSEGFTSEYKQIREEALRSPSEERAKTIPPRPIDIATVSKSAEPFRKPPRPHSSERSELQIRVSDIFSNQQR